MKIWDCVRSNRGFTLLEIIIVVILIGVLAAIALPQYAGFVEKGRVAEAVNAIGAIKGGMIAYKQEVGSYPTCTAVSGTGGITDLLKLTPSTVNWTYATVGTAGTSFTVTATRVSTDTALNGKTIIFSYPYATGSGYTGDHPNRPQP